MEEKYRKAEAVKEARKRGRPPHDASIPTIVWLYVELVRDQIKGRSEREACRRIEERFCEYGRRIPRETIRRQHKDGKKLIQQAGAASQAEESLRELRRRRDLFGRKIEPLALMGWTNEEMADMFGAKESAK
jgi:hypothetical protein